jgi:hypothetical protein
MAEYSQTGAAGAGQPTDAEASKPTSWSRPLDVARLQRRAWFGALRDALRKLLSGHPLVRSWRPGERGDGGDGATVVEL